MTAVNTTDVLYTSDIAKAARKFAQANGIEVGNRGRISLELLVRYFVSQPRTARGIASYVGVPVSTRGRLSASDAQKVAALIR